MRIAKEFMSDFHTRCPYNSFGKLLLTEGIDYPETLGGNCVFQCRRLTRDLIVEGLESEGTIRYLSAEERPHWVLVAQREAVHSLYDPFILQQEPFDITPLLNEEKDQLEYPLYPVVKGRSAFARVGRNSSTTIRVEVHALQTSGTTQEILSYTYPLGESAFHSTLPPDDYQLLASLRQKSLEIGCLMPKDGVMRLYYHSEAGTMKIIEGGKGIYPETKDPYRFRKKFDAMASRLSISPDDLRQYLDRSLQIYRRRHPVEAAACAQ